MEITHYVPENPLLKPYIAGIYLLQRHAGEAPERYLAFPGVHQFVTINREVICSAGNRQGAICYLANQPPTSLLVSGFGAPRLWSYQGPVQEWNICFKPLGLHHFLDSSLIDFESTPLQLDFTPFPDYAGHVEALYTLSDHIAQARFIEDYWASKLKAFKHAFLEELVGEILENNKEHRLNFSELARHFNISRHTLHTGFKRYVGTTPARFEKVHRFRNALAAYRLSGKSVTLTHISGEAAYFDQSHMIRDFKSFTGLTPKDFYKKRATFPKGDINWIFV
jgi:AraC-like DNA-binding protein